MVILAIEPTRLPKTNAGGEACEGN